MSTRDTWFTLLLEQNKHLRDEQSHIAIKNAILQVRDKEYIEQGRAHFQELNTLLDSLQSESELIHNMHSEYRVTEEGIDIFSSSTFTPPPQYRILIKKILVLLSPWRKGPYTIFDVKVESEWNSYYKWKRLAELWDIPSLCENNTILDVGCSNGYYSLTMLWHGAKWVLGIDPMPRNSFFFKLYNILLSPLPLYYEMWGVQDCQVLNRCFDTIFCMGILYHQRNPLSMLETLHASLNRKGIIVLETICLNNDEPYCLVPTDRYLKSRGYWFIPSVSVVKTWLQKTGFEVLACSKPIKTEYEEQHATEWIRGESLEHFIDGDDNRYTVEGYPAPYRVICIAQKKTSR